MMGEVRGSRLGLRLGSRELSRNASSAASSCSSVIDDTNADPKPLVWSADPTVLAAVKRGKQALESVH